MKSHRAEHTDCAQHAANSTNRLTAAVLRLREYGMARSSNDLSMLHEGQGMGCVVNNWTHRALRWAAAAPPRRWRP